MEQATSNEKTTKEKGTCICPLKKKQYLCTKENV